MSDFLVYLCVLKVYVNWDCVSVERRKYMRRSHFSHKERSLGLFRPVFYFNYTCMYTIREYSDYITEPCLYKVSCILLVNDA